MRAPSKLRLTVAGLAVGGVLVGSGLTGGAAHAQTADPFGFGGGSGSSFDFGGSSGGGSFDFGLTQPRQTDPGTGSSGSGLGDFFKDLGKDLGKELGNRALDSLLNRNRGGGNNTNTTQPNTGDGTVQSGDPSLTQQLPSTTSAGRRIPESIERVLRDAGVNFVDWLVKRQPGSKRDGFGSFKSPERYFRAELQRQNCRVPGYVRLFGTTVGRGRFTPSNFIGGDNLGRTLVLGRNSFLAPFGDKLKRFSTVNFVFLSKKGAEVLRPQPRVARNSVLEDRVRYSTDFLKRGVKYTVIVRYTNTCNEPVVDVLGKVRRR
ncbi:hypothetical protein SAMN05444920_106298 [Nonomuraea solani]|uniref:Uncharacterized protein n=1 Tax=Nonomuraea solani TaxID=1144553 RepID=A0A1H6DTZ4_9ACTN|nr:hypothetical protein [Nonomuraea solani]SEG88748.1 hypothetical protein SAMN05444920_106298 [Nonomuraea solani]